MKLTSEQEAIIATNSNIRINAVAGSGKTTTLLEYARTRPIGSRILYLAFNRSVKLEAGRKCVQLGLKNVQIETAHSLAYRHIVLNDGCTVRSQGYRTHEIADILSLKGDGEKHMEYVLASLVLRFMNYYCN
ncbi:MAG: DNA helicase, partial [Chitinophagaceae bacterium]